jgi:hypothetical protein
MEFLTFDINGAKVADFICTPLTSLALSKTRAFVIFSYFGRHFFARVVGLGALSVGRSHTAQCRTRTWNV